MQFIDTDGGTSLQQESQDDEDNILENQKLDSLAEFYESFVKKLVLFDPLDRDICDENEEQQNIKRNDLKKKIEQELVPLDACLL